MVFCKMAVWSAFYYGGELPKPAYALSFGFRAWGLGFREWGWALAEFGSPETQTFSDP